ncbi:unnamed protein product [Effrenium voratum]|uniref:Uncharacterized protein n=1 Tax=Effrenium voratum TaxID=2562239 RepID=A0AA36J357_9DINO|nr:unnamed protein product [Effrenium voratum]CAJ1398748.1 unnamed protein product [Effrenium voratum]CAJ1444311.1 unnamed protein product [Effrenium voratum]|mmetsp:Transcript_100088/g.238542  ORF Transcript_100088/g.238542 Transcript_100088/m.238542 type:complete len:366 (+) Transcript_100088:2-1099(+)
MKWPLFLLGALVGSNKLRSAPTVGVIVVGDPAFQRRYEVQIKSIRCYADRHGYEMTVLAASEFPECKRFLDFFFRKHCTVSKFLETKPSEYTAAVFDGDVVVAAPNRGLDKWINHGADIQLYNRCLFHEIMAGNYMVRNTAFARDFLMRWALYYDRKPQGFSSSDNGAIQLVVMETIKVEGFDTCYDMYRKLTESVTNLKPYWDYVHCTKEAIGPARAWKMEGGSLTMWPRLEFFAADGVFLNRWASDEVGPIMHHGVKDPNDVTSFYYKDLDKCELNRSSVIRSAEQLGETALHLAQSYPEYFPAGRSCKQCAEHCMKSFSCEPLEDAEQPRPRQVSSGPSTFVLEDSPESRRHSWGWSRWQVK